MSERDGLTITDEADIETMVSADSTPESAESTEDMIDNEEKNREFAERMHRFLDYAVLAGLLLLAFTAALQFYFNASQTIATWVNPEYRVPFQMAFNLALLLGTALGVSVQLRRLASDRAARAISHHAYNFQATVRVERYETSLRAGGRHVHR